AAAYTVRQRAGRARRIPGVRSGAARHRVRSRSPNNIEIMWEEPALARFLERLATMGRVICFDKRGTGISDPVPLGAIPTIERWMDDITTVTDAVGSRRIVLFGHGDGGPIAMLFAATYPERTEMLVLGDTFARIRMAVDYPDGLSDAAAEAK